MNSDLVLHNLIGNGTSGSSGSSSSLSYVRSSTYLPLPDISNTNNAFVGLYAIFPTNGYVSFVVSGKYTVDWGDGTTNNYAAGATADHTYIFNRVNSQVTTQGYKQVIIKITAQSGANLTSINLNVKNASASDSSAYTTGWLDIAIYGSYLTSLTFAGSAPAIYHRLLEQVNIYQCNIKNWSYMFAYCTALQSVPNCDIAHGTAFTYMFYNRYDLKKIPALAFNNPGSMAYAFTNCYSLQDASVTINSATNMNYTFFQCASLITLPGLSTGNVTSFNYTFAGCVKLKTVSSLDLSAATGASALYNMFAICPSLTTVGLMNVGSNLTLSDCNLSHDTLVNLLYNLRSINKTLDIRNNWGAPMLTASERTIATQRLWTILG